MRSVVLRGSGESATVICRSTSRIPFEPLPELLELALLFEHSFMLASQLDGKRGLLAPADRDERGGLALVRRERPRSMANSTAQHRLPRFRSRACPRKRSPHPLAVRWRQA